MAGNLDIYVSGSKASGNAVRVWCNNWTDTKWGVTIELTTTWDNRDTLFDNTLPGFVSERDLGLGQKQYVDTTYSSGNSLILSPVSGNGIYDMYDETTIVVRNIEDSPINDTDIIVRINGYVL